VIRSGRLGCVWLLALAGCIGPPPLPPLPADDPRPAALLASFAQASAGREALRGRARLAVDGEAGQGAPVRLRARQTLVLERPARLRIEVEGMLGTTLAVLAVDGGEYAYFETESRRFEQGPLPEDLLWRISGLALQPQEVVDVVLGAPRLAADLALRGAFAAPDGGVRVDLEGADGSSRALRFDAEGRLRELIARDPHRSGWTASFDDYAPVGGEALAHTVSIDTGSARAVLSLRDVELNPPLPADIFRLDGLAARSGAEGG
jgi:outer membrane biogenesis lipoprotein LolB